MNKFYNSLLILIIIISSNQLSAQIYISPDGSDSNPGTIEEPLGTFPAAINKATAGDTIYVRGGVYSLSTTISISKSGNQNNLYHLFAYQGEKPIFDFSSMPVGSSNRGIRLGGSYWYIKGINIKGAGDNGMNISGSNNIIEFCSFYENSDTGLQIGGGASNNNIINCDSYFNADPGQGNADGFAPKLDVGTNNYFYGCRAWQNSDDGWDGYMRGANDVNTTLENCWCFSNGYLKNGNESTGNGNGYKMGGSDDKTLMHNFTLKNCIAFDNRVKGFDQNNNKGSMTLYNCTALGNGTNFSITSVLNSGKTATITNGISLGSYDTLGSFVVQQTNSWQGPFVVNDEDFVSIDTTGVRSVRNTDGSLPNINFLHLAEGSDLINAGTDVGLPYVGNAPDLGAYEFDMVVPVELTSFNATVSGNSVLLSWITATELNNYGFEIQRETGNSNFITIGFVPGSGTTTESKKYNFVTNISSEGINIYRLKQIDFSGTFTYSDEIFVNYNLPGEFKLSQNYPNPFNPSTKFKYEIVLPGFVSLIIYNVLGKQVASVVSDYQNQGSYEINWIAKDDKGNSLPSGIYIAKLHSGNLIQTIKISLIK